MEIQSTNTANPVTLAVLLVRVEFPLGVLLAIRLTTGSSLGLNVPVNLDSIQIQLEQQYV